MSIRIKLILISLFISAFVYAQTCLILAPDAKTVVPPVGVHITFDAKGNCLLQAFGFKTYTINGNQITANLYPVDPATCAALTKSALAAALLDLATGDGGLP